MQGSVKTRYETDTTDPLYSKGKIAILKESIADFQEMLCNSLKTFGYLKEFEGTPDYCISEDESMSESDYDSELTDYDDL